MGWFKKTFGISTKQAVLTAGGFLIGGPTGAAAGFAGGSLLDGQDSAAAAMRQQYEAQVAAQEAQLNAIKQQNLLDASNASANIASVVTGDTLTTAAAIKKRKQSGNSISSSLGL